MEDVRLAPRARCPQTCSASTWEGAPMSNAYTVSFHDARMATIVGATAYAPADTGFTYTFENFFHPFVGDLISRLNTNSLAGVLDAQWQDSLRRDFFEALYSPS